MKCREIVKQLHFYLLRDPNYRYPLQRLAMVHMYLFGA
jgi:hypothetical protein